MVRREFVNATGDYSLPATPGDRRRVSPKLWLLHSAIHGFVSVAAGAFAAHALRSRMAAEALSVFETAARYQMYHALALLAVAALASAVPGRAVAVAGFGFSLGTLIFSGSLYLYCLTGLRWLGAITPIGGVGMLIGWAALAVAALKWRS